MARPSLWDAPGADEAATPTEEGERIRDERAAVASSLAKWDEEAEIAAREETPAEPVEARPEDQKGEWPEGLIGPEEANLPPSLGIDVQNAWAGTDGKGYLGVYAGVDQDADGILLLQTVDPVTMESSLVTVSTGTPGPVEIISFSGTTLLIRDVEGGTAREFDASAGEFVSS